MILSSGTSKGILTFEIPCLADFEDLVSLDRCCLLECAAGAGRN